MTTTIEDNELNTELQELYLKNKQWITDLDFFENELKFLHDFQQKKLAILSDKYGEGIEISVRIYNAQTYYTSLKEDLFDFMHQIESLIKKPKQCFDMTLIDTYAALELKIHKATRAFRKVKEMCADLDKPKPAHN